MKKKIKKIIMTFAMVLMVMAAVKATTIEAKAAGLFDPVYYAQTYPDVAAALGTDATALYNHYVNFGQKEGRIPYAGGQPGEIVDGIASATTATPAVQTPTETVDIGNGPYWLLSGQEVDKATFLQKKQELQQKFDAAGYARVGWTKEQVQARLLSLKEQYPEGTVVGTCSAGANVIRAALYGSDYEFCVGTVYRGEETNDEWIYVDGHVSCVSIGTRNIPIKSFLKVGDMLFTEGPYRTGHVMFVLSRDDSGITVVESNRDNDKAMHWGRRISWNELESGGTSDSQYVRQNQRLYVWSFKY